MSHRTDDDEPGTAPDGSQCSFPSCECPGDLPACPDYEETSDAAWYSRAAGGPDLRKAR